MTRRAHTTYKDSGIPWIEEIPGHWHVERLKRVSSVQLSNVDKVSDENEIPVRLCNYVDVYYNEFINESLEFMWATATGEEIRRFRLREGDVLITKDSEAWDDIAVPACVVGDHDDLLCGYHLAHIRPKGERLDGRYLFRAFSTSGINDQFQVEATGVTRFGLGKYWIDNGVFPVPPLSEQRAIAAFLDRETARIDGLIEKRQRQIELLQEKRAALISHAVTKGLDPNAKMKPSGIEWLGDVPEHWRVRALKRVARIGNGSTPSRENPEYWGDDGYPWLNSSVVNRDEVLDPVEFVTATALRECHLPKIQPPAVLVGITGQGKTRGMATTLRIESTINQHLAFLKPNCGICDVEYLRRVLDLAYHFLRIESEGAGSTKGAITCEQLANLRIPVPPLEEQENIVGHLNKRLTRDVNLVSHIYTSIEGLREYRTALISAAVTGKIDVQDEVAV